jgi:pilus assembly protein CpaB
MKSKTLIALFIALGCGVLAAVGIVNAIGDNSGAVVEATAPVLVANDFLDIHTPLTEENCHVEHWPVKLIPKEVVSDIASIDGMFNKMRLSKGLPIMIEQIADESFFQQDMIPPGHKVVAVKVKEDDTISGLLKPGQQVDIIGVVDIPSKDKGRTRLKIAKTFLKGIRVYSINGVRDGSAASDEKGRRGDAVVGVLVTEKQSEQIVLVQRVGALKLVLRAKMDNLDPEANPDFNQLFAGIISDPTAQEEPEVEEVTEVKDEAPSFVMTVYNGLESESHSFDENGRLSKPVNQSEGFTYGKNHRPQGGDESEVSFGDPSEFEEGFDEDQYQGE